MAEMENRGNCYPLGKFLPCSQDVVQDALAEQAAGNGGPAKRLGEILAERGHLTEEDLNTGIKAQRIVRLQGCPLFSQLPPEELYELSSCIEEITVQPEKRFITQDTRDNYLYILIDGAVTIYRKDPDGSEITLSEIRPGEPLGEMAYFSDGLRSASARAEVRSELVRIHYTDLSRCLDNYPNIAGAFLKQVTQRLRNTNLAVQENVQRRITAERSLKHLNEFLDLSEALALRVGIEGLIERVVHTASKLMSADRATLFLIDPVTGELWSKVAEGEEVREIRVPAGVGIVGWVANNREVVNIPDAYEDPRFNQEVDRKTGYRTRTIFCGPVYNLKGDVIGVIQVINKKTGVFDSKDEEIFRAFSHQAAISIENFNLYRRVLGSHEKMAILLDIATSVTQTLDLASLIQKIVTKIPEVLQCDRSAFFMLDGETDELWSVQAHGEGAKEIRFPATTGLAGHAVTHGELINIPDAYEDARFNQEIDRKTGYRTRSVLCVPLENREGEVIGVTQAINKKDGLFDDVDVDLLRAVSAQIAVATENAQLYERTAAMKTYLENVQESISNGILTIDRACRLITINRAALSMLDLCANDLIGRDLCELLNTENSHLVKLMHEVFESNRSQIHYDLELRTTSGTRNVNLNIVPLMHAGDGEQGLVLVLEDITREKRARSTLTRYMAKDIVDQMLKDSKYQALGGVRSEATVLFCDIRGFTTLSEELGAEETMDFLNQYFSMMVDEVFRQKGLLDKYIGDALMAVFGVPFPQEDDALRAVRTALNMKQLLAGFNRSRHEAGLSPVKIGIGINTGEVISGNMGSEKRMDYTVIGDSVNIASRLESLNKHYHTGMLISESTRSNLDGNFVTMELDRVMLKGKSSPTRIYEVLGEAGYQPTEPERCFMSGQERYQQGDFQAALAWLEQGQGLDPRCRIFADRCRHFIQEPPPPNWDGLWRAPTK